MNYKEERPWGCFEILFEEERLKIKRITVKPGKRLSLQSHERRAENWVIVQGQGLFTLDEETVRITPRQAMFIPEKAKHRIENTGRENLVFVEVQTGTYLGEDDITRFQDDFDRV